MYSNVIVELSEEVLNYKNFNLENVVTPVNVKKFKELLALSGYDHIKSAKLIEGFTKGFSIGYERPEKVQLTSPNLKLRIGNETVLWNKIMKEVKEK